MKSIQQICSVWQCGICFEVKGLMQEIEGDFKLALLRSKGLQPLCSMPHAPMFVYIEHNQQSEVWVLGEAPVVGSYCSRH